MCHILLHCTISLNTESVKPSTFVPLHCRHLKQGRRPARVCQPFLGGQSLESNPSKPCNTKCRSPSSSTFIVHYGTVEVYLSNIVYYSIPQTPNPCPCTELKLPKMASGRRICSKICRAIRSGGSLPNATSQTHQDCLNLGQGVPGILQSKL